MKRECGEAEMMLAIAMSLLALVLAATWVGLVATGNPR